LSELCGHRFGRSIILLAKDCRLVTSDAAPC
jgi:hypothetical protein